MADFHWDGLRLALAISRAGSLSRAGERLGLDQSTVGRRLTKLEADLGTVLFQRSRKGLVATEAGQSVVRRASEVERRLESLIESIDRTGRGLSGTVEIYGNAWMLERLAARCTWSLLTAHPNLNLFMNGIPVPDEQSTAPAIGLFLYAKPRPPRFELRLGGVPYRVYRSSRIADDANTWFAFQEPGLSRRAYLPALNRIRKPSEPIVFTASTSTILLNAAEAGIGKGLLPMCLASERPGLRQVGTEGLTMEATLHVHPDTVQLSRVQAVIRWIREAFRPVFLGETQVALQVKARQR